MTPAVQYANVVFDLFHQQEGISTLVKNSTIDWLQGEGEGDSGAILAAIRDGGSQTSKTRYRFPEEDPATEIFKAVFAVAFQRAPDQIIARADKLTEKPLSLKVKRVVWIDLPNAVGEILGSTLARAAFTAAIVLTGCYVAYSSYVATAALCSTRIVPLLINHTPTQMVRIFTFFRDLMDQLYRYPFRVVGAACAARWVILRAPRIPYLTPLGEAIDPVSLCFMLFGSPHTIGTFLMNTSLVSATHVWNATGDAGALCRELAQKSKRTLFPSKEKAYQHWVDSLRNFQVAQ